MSWFTFLAIALIIAVIAAVSGVKPKGSRHVAHTRLLGMARVILVIVALIFIGMALRKYLNA